MLANTILYPYISACILCRVSRIKREIVIQNGELEEEENISARPPPNYETKTETKTMTKRQKKANNNIEQKSSKQKTAVSSNMSPE